MEALAAISLAGNIVQFVCFAGGIVSKSRQLQSSADGVLLENLSTKQVTEDLKILTDRLRQPTSACSADVVLERLWLGCESVAKELLAALAKLELNGKQGQFRSLRKALRSVWSKDMIAGIESRLSAFRDELDLHVTIDLRFRVDALSVQQSAAYQLLDESAKATAQIILDALYDGHTVFTDEIKAQTDEIRLLHVGTQLKVTEEVEEACAFVEVLHEQTKLDVFGAIDAAKIVQLDAIEVATQATTSAIEEQHNQTRKNIVAALEREHETIKGDVAGLQQSLNQLHAEMERRTAELKDVILQISRTRKDEERRSLQNKGNSISIILMSLQTLYLELQGWLGTMLDRAAIVFGPAKFKQYFGISTNPVSPHQIPVTSPSPVDELFSSIQVLSTYYSCYYHPSFSSGLLSSRSTLLESSYYTWQAAYELPETIETNISTISEHHAILALARGATLNSEVKNFVWLMAAITTVLDKLPFMFPNDAVSVLSGPFGLIYSKLCSEDKAGHYPSIQQDQKRKDKALRKDNSFEPLRSLQYCFWMEFLNPSSTWKNRCAEASVGGKRLREDVEVWKFFAGISGLNKAIATFISKENYQTPIRDSNAEEQRARLACFLFAFMRFGAPCQVKEVKNAPQDEPIVHFQEQGILVIDSEQAYEVWALVRTLHHIGLPIRFISSDTASSSTSSATPNESAMSSHISQLRETEAVKPVTTPLISDDILLSY